MDLSSVPSRRVRGPGCGHPFIPDIDSSISYLPYSIVEACNELSIDAERQGPSRQEIESNLADDDGVQKVGEMVCLSLVPPDPVTV